VQDRLDGHDTPSRPLLVAPAGLGVRWIDQLVPFHRSASVSSLPVRLVKNPTAVHDVAEAHDTPANWLFTPTVVGVGCTAQPEATAPAGTVSNSMSVT
jgi:hypothetical protein